jgi:replication-associated recombination protein RarA
MFERLIQLSEKQSAFLFGARGVGKTTLLMNTIKMRGFLSAFAGMTKLSLMAVRARATL